MADPTVVSNNVERHGILGAFAHVSGPLDDLERLAERRPMPENLLPHVSELVVAFLAQERAARLGLGATP